MMYVSYLRELATHYRKLAIQELDRPNSDQKAASKAAPGAHPGTAEEYLELAEVCGQVAADIEDRTTPG
jgi:hypothetical protein